MGCVLQTKKRYAGYMYETADQKEPVFDAKGIETVRRDSVPAVTKVGDRTDTHGQVPIGRLRQDNLLAPYCVWRQYPIIQSQW